MVPLAFVSLLLYKSTIGLFVFVRRVKFDEITDDRLSARFGETDDAAGSIQRQMDILDETLWRFKQLVRSRLKYAQALLAAAPLLGLLGTVMGMLDMFQGLALRLGHETTRTVADGISRALITTETGLIIAIPALFLIHWIRRETQAHELRILEKRTQLMSRLET